MDEERANRLADGPVGGTEVRKNVRQIDANHPQSLWITLWAAVRRNRQVAYRKRFYFLRSMFEL